MSNGRVLEEDSPVGRMAAVAVTTARRIERKCERTKQALRLPDYSDYREDFELPLERQKILWLLEELDRWHGLGVAYKVQRKIELIQEQARIEADIVAWVRRNDRHSD